MKDFKGTYTGFCPVFESATGIGEIEITVGEETIKVRLATGRGISELELKVGDFKPADADKFNDVVETGEEYTGRVIVFRHDSGHPVLFFLKDPTNDECALMIMTGSIADRFGPTMFCNASQFENGLFDQLLNIVEREDLKGATPRLRNNGRPEKEYFEFEEDGEGEEDPEED